MDQGLIRGIYRSLIGAADEPTRGGFIARTRTRLGIARQYVKTYPRKRLLPDLFAEVHTFCLFVGHARSGSTLLGGLVDAHPSAIIADEVNIFPYLSAGFRRDQLFSLLLDAARKQAEKGRTKPGRDAKQYSYQVPGQWQGRFDRLLVIGNRKAGGSTQYLGRNSDLLDRLQAMLGEVHLKLVFSIRNPYDTISTMSIRTGDSLEQRVNQYFANCDTIRSLRSAIPSDHFLLMRHEDLLQNPQLRLTELCHFLGLNAPEDYLEACTGILYRSPSQSRHKAPWSEPLIQTVQSRMGEYEFLRGYSFD